MTFRELLAVLGNVSPKFEKRGHVGIVCRLQPQSRKVLSNIPGIIQSNHPAKLTVKFILTVSEGTAYIVGQCPDSSEDPNILKEPCWARLSMNAPFKDGKSFVPDF
jgi:hypothetical protein